MTFYYFLYVNLKYSKLKQVISIIVLCYGKLVWILTVLIKKFREGATVEINLKKLTSYKKFEVSWKVNK